MSVFHLLIFYFTLIEMEFCGFSLILPFDSLYNFLDNREKNVKLKNLKTDVLYSFLKNVRETKLNDKNLKYQ